MGNTFIQISGPFSAYKNILEKLEKNSFRHIGIQSDTSHKVKINGDEYEIGKTGMLEFSNVIIDSLAFMQNESELTLVDIILE